MAPTVLTSLAMGREGWWLFFRGRGAGEVESGELGNSLDVISGSVDPSRCWWVDTGHRMKLAYKWDMTYDEVFVMGHFGSFPPRPVSVGSCGGQCMTVFCPTTSEELSPNHVQI